MRSNSSSLQTPVWVVNRERAACWCDAVLQDPPSDLSAGVFVSRLTAAPRCSEPLVFCTSQPAASAWTRSPTPSAGAARWPDVEHLHGEHDRSFRRSAFVSAGPEARLACAFAQSGFEALQEAAEQQSPSGRRRGDTPTPVPGGIRWVPARQQGGHISNGGSLCRPPSAGLHHLSLCLGASSSCGNLRLWASSWDSCVCIALSSSCRTNNGAERYPPRLNERMLPWRPAL